MGLKAALNARGYSVFGKPYTLSLEGEGWDEGE
jgi:hypothetical protein